MGHTLTLDLPENVYQCLRQQAEQTGQSPETVAVQWLVTATQASVDDPLELGRELAPGRDRVGQEPLSHPRPLAALPGAHKDQARSRRRSSSVSSLAR